MSNSASGRPAIQTLTSLRFFAAFWVVLFHVHAIGLNTGGSAAYLDFALLGYLGVSFFFVLSGFILVYVLRWTFRHQSSILASSLRSRLSGLPFLAPGQFRDAETLLAGDAAAPPGCACSDRPPSAYRGLVPTPSSHLEPRCLDALRRGLFLSAVSLCSAQA